MKHLTLLEALHKNAPSLFREYVERRRYKLNARLIELRELYIKAHKNGAQDDLKRYTEEGKEINKTLEVYTDIEAQPKLVDITQDI